ncbi:hypothetical protein BUALT_Bualt06G0064600 [Buddleja alternifolia]|uniref:Uncharacterized protein n=1 Tax=Buddleja alternifolia TaxID=168488 RepID=A0AAV6XEN6_9LAMI|nr:hypothetical protein BUALT_Bualt06G0064600 [Buddleja alternifolia]
MEINFAKFFLFFNALYGDEKDERGRCECMGSIKIADACDANLELVKSGDIRILQPIFRIYGKCRTFCGPIFTVKCLNTMSGLRSSLKPKAKVGIVINGCIRDVNEINDRCDIGVRALTSHPGKPGKKGMVEEHVSIHVAGTEE